VEHDVKENTGLAEVGQKMLSDGQVPGGGDGKKFGQPLQGAEEDGLGEGHERPLGNTEFRILNSGEKGKITF
jgi:hypothetical protein